jgi:DNA-nicking Smr family endonuclease
MKFEIGDIVSISLTQEEGKVVERLGDKLVMVEVKGVQFPIYEDQIEYPYFKRFTQHIGANKKQAPEIKPKTYIDDVPKERKKALASNKEELGLSIQFFPKYETDFYGDEVITLFKIYLMNQTNSSYHFTFQLNFLGQKEFSISNVVEAFHDFYLYDVKFEDFSDSPEILVTIQPLEEIKGKVKEFQYQLKFKGKQLFQQIEQMQKANQPSINKLIFTSLPNQTTIDTPMPYSPNASSAFSLQQLKQNLPPAQSVVDLHIEKILNDYKHLSNAEIIIAQLNHFEKYLDLAIAHRLNSMIIIHGIGTGKLKEEVHQSLKLNKHVNYFINQYDPRFGYGATEIFLKH